MGTNVRIGGCDLATLTILEAAQAFIRNADRTEDEFIQGYLIGLADALQLAVEAERGGVHVGKEARGKRIV